MATDAEIRAAGFYAVPKNEYLQNEFKLPTTEEEKVTESFGIPNTNAFTNSGDDNYTRVIILIIMVFNKLLMLDNII